MGAVTRFVGVNNTLTLEHFANLRGLRSLELSLRMAGAAAVTVAVGGLLLAYLIARTRFPGRRLIEMVALLGFALPGTVLGIGYVLAFNEPPLTLTGTFCDPRHQLRRRTTWRWRSRPASVSLPRSTRAWRRRRPISAWAALGTFVRVVLPLMGTAFLVALTYAFVSSMLTLSAIVFLISPGREPAASVIFAFARMGELGRRLRPVAPPDRRGPRRPRPPVDGRQAERPARARHGAMKGRRGRRPSDEQGLRARRKLRSPRSERGPPAGAAGQALRPRRGRRRRRRRDPGGRAGLVRRPERLRQDDAPAHGRRVRPPGQRPDRGSTGRT